MAIKAKISEVRPLVAATFPDYKGRKLSVEPAVSVTLYDLNWSGGSRNQYRTCTLSGEFIGSADKHNAKAPWVNFAEGQRVEIPPGCVVVKRCIFSGVDCGLTFYIRPDDMPGFITDKAA